MKIAYHSFAILLLVVSVLLFWQNRNHLDYQRVDALKAAKFSQWVERHFEQLDTDIIVPIFFGDGRVRIYIAVADGEEGQLNIVELSPSKCENSPNGCVRIADVYYRIADSRESNILDQRATDRLSNETSLPVGGLPAAISDRRDSPVLPNQNSSIQAPDLADDAVSSGEIESVPVYTVSAPLVNVRRSADRTSGVTGQVSPVDKLFVKEVDGSWSRVSKAPNIETTLGWVWTPLLVAVDD